MAVPQNISDALVAVDSAKDAASSVAADAKVKQQAVVDAQAAAQAAVAAEQPALDDLAKKRDELVALIQQVYANP